MILRLLTFLLLLLPLLVTSAGYGNCPYRCECQPHHSIPTGWKAECGWDALPADSPFSVSSSIRSLSIRCADSPASVARPLSATVLKGLHQLHQLKIHNCPITRIEADAFNSLDELRELVFTEISSEGERPFVLSDESLLPLSRLNTFQLSDSRLEALPASFFCTLPNLQMLNISGNSLGASSLSSNSACSAAHLIIVDLSRNRLGEILQSTLDAFPAVRQLLLAHNSIPSMHSASFNKTRLLQQLDLEGNGLRSIGLLPDTVVSINAAHNSLASLPASIAALPALVAVNLSHNALTTESMAAPLRSTDLESLDVSFNRLEEAPAALWNASVSSLAHLDLSHNKISVLTRDDFRSLTAIQTLNLRSNAISIVDKEVLAERASLASLDLSHNEIALLAPSALAGLTLDALLLNNNRLEQVPLALSQLARCKSIDLSFNAISSISSNLFSKIAQLAKLDLSNNKLEKLSQYEISECPHLTSLSLSQNVLRDLSALSLAGCPSLRRLDLSLNRLPALSIAQSSLNSLRHLNLSSNLLVQLEWEGLPAKVEHLHLDHNRIRALKGNPANHRSKVLSLSHNALTALSSSLLPDSIESLDVSYNSISAIAPSTFAPKAQLAHLNLAWNGLRSLPLDSINVPDALSTVSIRVRGNPLECSCEMDWIKKGASSTKHLVVVDLAEAECLHLVERRQYNLTALSSAQLLCNYTTLCGAGCNCCAFSTCDCKSDCPRGCECWNDGERHTNVVRCRGLRGRDAEKFSIKDDIPMLATHIYLSDFPIPVLKQATFFGRPKLQHVHINSTSLRLVEPMAFKGIQTLQLLDLSRNALRELRAEAFFKTGNITHLFLDHNLLERVDYDLLKKLPHLKGITLHDNRLEDVPLSLSALPSLHSLTLSANRFRCDCEPARFNTPAFLMSHRDNILDASRLRCVENVTRAFRDNDTTALSFFAPNNGDDLFEMSIDEFLRDANSSICNPISEGIFGAAAGDWGLFALVGVFLLLLLLTAISLVVAAIRRNRCGMRHKRYILNSSMNCSTTPGTSPLPVPLMGYDVFISYSQNDEKLVYDKIVRQLENDYSLCLLHRDGPKYDTLRHAVSDELTQLMRSSSTIIVVITKNFLEQEWLSTQIKISHKLVAKDKQQFLAVFGDDVDMNALDEELGAILRKKERVRFNDHLYYNILQNVLPLPSRHSPSDDASQIYYEMGAGNIVPSAIV